MAAAAKGDAGCHNDEHDEQRLAPAIVAGELRAVDIHRKPMVSA